MPNSEDTPAVLLTSPDAALRDLMQDVAVIDGAVIDGAAIDQADWRALPDRDRRRVRAMLTSGVQPIGADDLAAFPNLGLIVTLGAGYDGLDMAAVEARDIRLVTGSGINADAVADHTIGLFLAAARGIVANDRLVREGRWRKHALAPVRSVGALVVGIVGLGAIGRAIAARLRPFGCPVAWTGPRPKPEVALPYVADLIELARRSDVLIVAAPLNPATHHMVDAAVIDALGPEGLIVNVGRGPLVDEDALISALREGRLRGAALDVFEEEPTPPARWQDVPGIVLSPHTAGVTRESMAAIRTTAARRAAEFVLTGRLELSPPAA